ncbi:Uncharacterised protein [Bacteroides eggerthii]|uniref:Transmembrane protein n=1 Tax=Bacteroides eggerthii TaxID=28111 RepID=A0A380YP87_9BACE|nr:Uncharacterised protein [Bacteroides eggerthii]
MEKMNIHGLYNNLIIPIPFWSICSYLSIILGNSVVSKKLVMYLIGIKIKIRHFTLTWLYLYRK